MSAEEILFLITKYTEQRANQRFL